VTPEGKVKEQVKRLLRKFKVYYHMPVMNGMGSPTLDFVCCFNGRYITIETKAPGGKPTKRQQQTMQEVSDAGGFVFVVSDEASLNILEAYLQVLSP
jgi:hypothetical protein